MEDDMTIDQVAELAYVSRSVVSRVLNDHPNVSEEARERVLKVIEEHDYRPSSVARSLATDRSFEIGVLTPRRGDESLANGYWPLLYSGIFEQCLERGYFVSLSMVSDKVEDEIQDRARDQRFDGYILITTEVTDLVGSVLESSDVPAALIGNAPGWESLSSVDIDNVKGGYEAGRHLCELGYDEIGLILGSLDLEESVDRRRGFEQALGERGCTLPDAHVAVGDYSQETGYDIVTRWHEAGTMPRALFCASDAIAMGVLLALQENGYAVPADVAVVGFDGLPASEYTVPPLTTVRQPVYEKGQTAVNQLIDQIETPETDPSHTELDPELVVRESCGADRGRGDMEAD
jgi:Transcriptional regulators